MPKLIKLYILNVAIGFALSAAFVALLLWTNSAGLRDLIMADRMGWLALIVLWVLNGIVFAGVQFAIAIMRMAGRDDAGGTGCKIPHRMTPAPIAVKTAKPKRPV